MVTKPTIRPLAVVVLGLASLVPTSFSFAAVSDLLAEHRSGQTFITWTEDATATGYHVYRHTAEIDDANFDDAERLTTWGPLDQDTSVNQHEKERPKDGVPEFYKIKDDAAPLNDSTGLFVYTTQPGDSAQAYYAITTVTNGVESSPVGLDVAVTESVASPKAVLIASKEGANGGKGLVYTQFMDYANWNPTFQDYAYSFAVALPYNWDPDTEYPLSVILHDYGATYQYRDEVRFNHQVIEVHPDDPLPYRQSWWFGFSASHNYEINGRNSIPTTGPIENFNEQQVLRAVSEVVENYNIDEKRIHVLGQSMGAAGAVALGVRYGNLFSGIYANQPITNFVTSFNNEGKNGLSNNFKTQLETLWGSRASNFDVLIKGQYADGLQQYSEGGTKAKGVWDWMNHQEMVQERRGEDMAYLSLAYGGADTAVVFGTQGTPMIEALENADAGYTASVRPSASHYQNLGKESVTKSMFGLGNASDYPWRYPIDQSYLGITNATSTDTFAPNLTDPNAPTVFFNDEFEWRVPWGDYGNNRFNADDMLETATTYSVSIRSEIAQQADITPRRTSLFSPIPGQQCTWNATRNSDGVNTGSGTVFVDTDGLVTVPGVTIADDAQGTKLALDCSIPPLTELDCNVANLTRTVPSNRWQLLTLPCSAPSGSSLNDVFADDLPPDAVFGTDWAVFTYQAGVGYASAGDPEIAAPPEPGQGFWFIQFSGSDITIDMPANSVSDTVVADAPCSAGFAGCVQESAAYLSGDIVTWNMLGNPLPITVKHDDIRVSAEDACNPGDYCTLTQAATDNVIHDTLFTYAGEAYDAKISGGILDIWDGHWSAVLPAGNLVTLHWPTVADGTAGVTNGGSDNGDDDGSDNGGGDNGGGDNGGGTTGGTSDGTLTAVHRDGQTFLTWGESDPLDYYHVYRSDAPIDASNISNAEKLTEKWGALDFDSSVNKYRSQYGGTAHIAETPENFVIADLADPLDNDTGLFVYTTQPNDSTTAYYAVTSVTNGAESIASPMTLESAITESVSAPKAVLTVSVNGGSGRLYTQYMDYTKWNPTYNGYAYNYAVALPVGYDPTQSYPLMIELHAYGADDKFLPNAAFGWQVIQLWPRDPGTSEGTSHTWWYGYAADHNYQSGDIPGSGTVANFTEQRVMRSIEELIADSDYNIDEQRIHAYGNSMGASGVLSWGMRYPTVLSGVYASQPMTNYATSPRFVNDFRLLWGDKDAALPIVNDGPYSDGIQSYNGDYSVWEWMNHQFQLNERRGDTFSYLMTSHGKLDVTIDWKTQGRPWVQALTDAKTGFSAIYNDSTHNSQGFDSVVKEQFGRFGDDQWRYPVDLSYPAIQNATGSSATAPNDDVVTVLPINDFDVDPRDEYNLNIIWGTEHMPPLNPGVSGVWLPDDIDVVVDQPDLYAITLRSLASDVATDFQSADITPRRTQEFQIGFNETCNWQAINRNDGTTVSGTVTGDTSSLATVENVPIFSVAGTRLEIDCSINNL